MTTSKKTTEVDVVGRGELCQQKNKEFKCEVGKRSVDRLNVGIDELKCAPDKKKGCWEMLYNITCNFLRRVVLHKK